MYSDTDVPKELSPEHLNKALTESYRFIQFVATEAADIKDGAQRDAIIRSITACITAINAKVVFTLYRDHTQALDEINKQAKIAIVTLKKQRIADKVFHDTVKGTIQ